MPTYARRVGRYVHLEVQGVDYEVYFESAGNPEGIPLVLQHTAGSDGHAALTVRSGSRRTIRAAPAPVSQ